jgi:hypothetical protein
LDYDAWLLHLPDDYEDYNFILSGIRFGFNIVNASDIKGYVRQNNHSSVADNNIRLKVEQAILLEISHGRYKLANVTPNIISPLGAIVKQSGDIRLIHDCSRPVGKSLNEYAPVDNLRYQSLEDAREFITQGCWLAKVDLASAYRSVRIHPSNYCATGLSWRFTGDNHDTTLVDCRLPFGASRSPYVFNKLSQAVVHIMKNKGFKNVIAYLDDFLVCEESYDRCMTAFNTLLWLLRQLGFSISYPKLVAPTRRIVFLGIEIDTIQMTFSLPEEKIENLRSIISSALSTRTFKKRFLQVLVGRLCFASRVYYGGLCFLRRMIDIINKLKHPWSRFRTNANLRADLQWWSDILMNIKGKGTMPIIDSRNTISIVVGHTPMGWRAANDDVRIQGPWQSISTSANQLLPTYKEVLSVIPAAQHWAHQWTNRHVIVYCNNKGAVSIINKGSCSNVAVMNQLRLLWKWSVMFNFRLSAKYYPRVGNYFTSDSAQNTACLQRNYSFSLDDSESVSLQSINDSTPLTPWFTLPLPLTPLEGLGNDCLSERLLPVVVYPLNDYSYWL